MDVSHLFIDSSVTDIIKGFPSAGVCRKVLVHSNDMFVRVDICGCPYVYEVVFCPWIVFDQLLF